MLLVFDESAAEFILELLRFEGIEVPDQLGLITVSPDGLCCDTVRPSLTYLRLPFFRIGYEAARLLDERLSHPGTPPVVRRIGVDYIAERQSTSLRLSGDPIVDDILRRIAHHAHRPTSVGEILKGVSLKRRATEMRFAAVTGLTLRAAIERERLRAACELLETTDLPIVDVAARTGFSGPSLFCKAFRKAHGRTPAVFRSLLRNMNRLAQAEESEPSTPLRRRVRARR
jgi:LacI family transcriptional regulator